MLKGWPSTETSEKAPTLNKLIRIAKKKIRQELMELEHNASLDDAAAMFITQGRAKTDSKVAARVERGKFLTVVASALPLTVIFLVLYIVEVSAKNRGRCVGVWLNFRAVQLLEGTSEGDEPCTC
jgi:hypothetical protein